MNLRQHILLVVLSLLLVSIACRTNYSATILQQSSSYFKFQLKYQGNDTYYLKHKSTIIKNAIFELRCYTYNDFAFKITDLDQKRFQVPQQDPFPVDPLANFSFPINSSGFSFNYTLQKFDIEIRRKSNNAVLFSTYKNPLIFSKYYLEIGTDLASQYLYGLGERFTNSFRTGEGRWTIHSRDRAGIVDYGNAKGHQTYGYYPFYLMREKDNTFHINYFRNSNAMDVIIKYNGNQPSLVYKTIGGVFDFRFILGSNPEQLIEKFHTFIGKSTIPPFWSMGFHQCRWGYHNVSKLQEVLQKYEENNLPLDTIWSDIDYMHNFQDFTIDETRFPLDRMKKITDKYHYVPIIDAGIKIGIGTPYIEGAKRDVFLRNAAGKDLIGAVWPGPTTFVDFFHPNSSQYWQDMLGLLYEKVKFSGIWLDMNQVSNFCNGQCQPQRGDGFDYTKDLPYEPGQQNPQARTLSLNASHYGNITQANAHPYFAFLESAATFKFLSSKGMRPFIISRSTTLGSNKFTFHWTGDNQATFEFLQGSITDNFHHQLWGIQMVGADICGFMRDTDVQLCSRWLQVGGFYPFARSHSNIGTIPQQPYALGPIVLTSALNALYVRYALLKHYYTVFVTKKGAGTIFKPLMFVFPDDQKVYEDEIANTQIMIGQSLMICPIIHTNATSRKAYFPKVGWYDLHNPKIKYSPGMNNISNNLVYYPAPLFLRQGYSIMTNEVRDVRKTSDLSNSFYMVVGLKKNQAASNSTNTVYESVLQTLSIQDYNNQSQISSCISGGCKYALNLTFNIQDGNKTLTIISDYQGVQGLNEMIQINAVSLMFEDQLITNVFDETIKITKSGTIVVPIQDQGLQYIKIGKFFEPENYKQKLRTQI